ncbi:protein transporter HofB [Maribrevibacterium harenarium]|uniref:Protein transporter HofB n=1 Tax=Maribrevibacterium harenarium TaxID=2589817 RepID=A0A501X4Y3_9GAMM|nr:ATPase, T2SS/T4P/T4SS family [Maribrevibacterium harenarium]TPE55610.1 protein transporter HofB [Maribrevibacterium harenarium]
MTLEQLLDQALAENCSDIHLHITNDVSTVLFRRYGTICRREVLVKSGLLLNRIKIQANLDIGEHRRTQEGQFEYRYDGNITSIRVSVIATTEGEKVALRLLTPARLLTIEELAMPVPLQQLLRDTLSQTSGLILVCGATGAGKTTTLYSALQHLNDGSRTIFTIEDPVEVDLPGVYQCQANNDIGIYSTYLLKSFMRQDPDVILVGEIRDQETAELAIAAAMTGHLVLATLHAHSPIGAIQRLQHWQIDYFSLASILRLVVHQTMSFDAQGYRPQFSAIFPNWTTKLPAHYQALINEPSNWYWI